MVRIGATVRRPRRAWSSTVQAFLAHLRGCGIEEVPEPLGFDERGREVLSWIDGVDGREARSYGDESLADAARLIRRIHDASRSFTPAADAAWRPDATAPPGAFVCHGDLNPANAIYRDGRLHGLIDWDHARPSTELWDLGNAARTFVPLYATDDARRMGYPPGRRAERLAVFCDAYGMDDATRRGLLGAVRARAGDGSTPFSRRGLETIDHEEHRWRRAISG